MTGGRRSRLLVLIEKLKTAQPEEADQIKREVAELLGSNVFYVREGRFEPAEEREEALGEVEEQAEEEGLEPVGEAEEVVEEDEYLGQRLVRRALPEEKPRARRLPY
jgi:hypothetical protein